MVVILITLPAQAFELSNGQPWAASEATFYTSPLNLSGVSLTSTESRDAFIEAMSEWTDNSSFNYLTTTGSANPCLIPSSTNPNNNFNGYTFMVNTCGVDENGDPIAFGTNTLAIAITWRSGSGGTGPIIQSGIVFNSTKTWDIFSTGGTGSDFRRVAVHELGHSLGLAHTTVTPPATAIMTPSADSTEVPQIDDLNGVEALYGIFDTDSDGVAQHNDNCPMVNNPSQTDNNNNGVGDACDNDDGDSHLNSDDNCPLDDNEDQSDINNNGVGDVCDNSDGDSHLDSVDNCPFDDNEDQAETGSGVGVGDVCDPDDDGIRDGIDNCPTDPNPAQLDLDDDGEGDDCDSDADGDTVLSGLDDDDLNQFICSDNDADMCDDCSSGTFDPTNDGLDSDNDGICNLAEEDDDDDGIDDNDDNCPTTPNTDQMDSDGDGIGDVCDDDEFCLPIRAINNNIAVICI